jgi:hypothetical protein
MPLQKIPPRDGHALQDIADLLAEAHRVIVITGRQQSPASTSFIDAVHSFPIQHYFHHKPPFLANNLGQRHECEARTYSTQVFGRTLLQPPHSTNSLPRCARRSKEWSIRAGVTYAFHLLILGVTVWGTGAAWLVVTSFCTSGDVSCIEREELRSRNCLCAVIEVAGRHRLVLLTCGCFFVLPNFDFFFELRPPILFRCRS